MNYLVAHFREELLTVNFKEQISEVEVPLYFIAGEYDYITPTSLVEEFHQIVKAPSKEIYIVENVAHDTHFENPDAFIEICLRVSQLVYN